MRRAVLLLALVLVPLAGCGGGPAPAAEPVPVTYQKVGGIAGTRESVTVGADGQWRHEAIKLHTRGTLTADQRAALARLTADPALPAEAARERGVSPCVDGYEVSLDVGGTTVRWAECGPETARPPVAARIARLLLDSTG